MGTTKYAVPDLQAFEDAMLAACADDEERGIVYILALTGMHVSSLLALTEQSIVQRGGVTFLTWVRPKTDKRLEAPVPPQCVPLLRAYFAHVAARRAALRPPCTRQRANYLLRCIGRRCGYPDTSSMTFRHNLCARLIDRGESMLVVPSLMGCSTEVAVRNYAKRKELRHFEDSQTGGSI